MSPRRPSTAPRPRSPPESVSRQTSSSFSGASQSRQHRPGAASNTDPDRSKRPHFNAVGAEHEVDSEGETEDVEEWEGGGQSHPEFISGSPGSASMPGRGRRRKADEPMKPITVVLYVVFFYLIWQILTRSTETEILSHLAKSSPHHYHAESVLPESAGSSSLGRAASHGYHSSSPYGLPHIPSPLPASSSSSSSSPSTARWILGIAFYPLYLVLMFLSIPLPFILSALGLVIDILSTLLLPFTFTGRLLGNVFVLTPYTWCRAFMRAVYPVYVFVGGMIGVGCVLGLGAGWAGRKVLDLLTGSRVPNGHKHAAARGTSGDKHSTSRVSRSQPSFGSRTHRSSSHAETPNPGGYSYDPQTPSRMSMSTRPRRTSQLSYREPLTRPSHAGHRPYTSRQSSSSGDDSQLSSTESLPPNPRTPAGSYRRNYPDAMAQSLYPDDSVSLRGATAGAGKGGPGHGRATGREGMVLGTRQRRKRPE